MDEAYQDHPPVYERATISASRKDCAKGIAFIVPRPSGFDNDAKTAVVRPYPAMEGRMVHIRVEGSNDHVRVATGPASERSCR
jgi:hypothetical protein